MMSMLISIEELVEDREVHAMDVACGRYFQANTHCQEAQ